MNKNKEKANKKGAAQNLAAKESRRGNSFREFLRQKEQLLLMGYLFLAFLAIHIILHYFYPTPDVANDTHGYLQSARTKLFNGYRPYGYSAFLNLVGWFSGSTYAMYLGQFLLHFVSLLFFLLTVKYLLRPKNALLWNAFVLLAACSPSAIYLTNYVISDSLFASLTVLWLCSCFWIISKRNLVACIIHLILLYMLIQVRYTGLFYLAFSSVIFLWIFRTRAAALFAIVPLIMGSKYYTDTKKENKFVSGVTIFSGFAGWQTANNALHIIPYIDLTPEDLPDDELRQIHRFVKFLPDSVYLQNGLSIAYMWNEHYPLKNYMYKCQIDNKWIPLHAWAKCSAPYQRYGNFLIKKYPMAFIRHYLIPNCREFFYPASAEVLEKYTMLPPDNVWFKQDASLYRAPRKDVFSQFYSPLLPFITLLSWVLFFIVLLAALLFHKKVKLQQGEWKIFLFVLCFLLVYAAFSIYTSPFASRYGVPINLAQLLLPYMLVNAFRTEPGTTPANGQNQ